MAGLLALHRTLGTEMITVVYGDVRWLITLLTLRSHSHCFCPVAGSIKQASALGSSSVFTSLRIPYLFPEARNVVDPAAAALPRFVVELLELIEGDIVAYVAGLADSTIDILGCQDQDIDVFVCRDLVGCPAGHTLAIRIVLDTLEPGVHRTVGWCGRSRG